MPLPVQPPERDPQSAKYRWPRTRAAFRGLVDVAIETGFLVEALESVLKFVDRLPVPQDLHYEQPAEFSDRLRSDRMKDAIEHVRQSIPDDYRIWTDKFDHYHRCRHDWYAAIERARAAADNAEPELDAGTTSPFEMPSVQIRAALGRMSGVVPKPMVIGSLPPLDEPGVPTSLRQCLPEVVAWENKLRALAYQELPRDLPRPALIPSATHGPSWTSTLATLGRQFEVERERFPELLHFILIATHGHQDKLTGPPWVWPKPDQIAVYRQHRVRPVYHWRPRGIAREHRVVHATAAGETSTLHEAVSYSSGFFGCVDDRVTTLRAVEALERLASLAWACIPDDVKAGLLAEPWLNPAGQREGLVGWIHAMYALAWQSEPGTGLTADRVACVQEGLESCSLDLEYLIRLPDPVPRTPDPSAAHGLAEVLFPPQPKAEIVAEHLGEPLSPTMSGKTWIDAGVKVPPAWFAAFLEPDLFLASRLAVDTLLIRPLSERSKPPPPWRTTSVTGEAPSITDDRTPPVVVGVERSIAEPFIFRREGQLWHASFNGTSGRFEDLVGMRYLATLLARRTERNPISAIELVGFAPAAESDTHTAQPALDEVAKRELQEEIGQLDREIEIAKNSENERLLVELESQREAIMEQLRSAAARGGRGRAIGPGSAAEKARVSVAQALKRAYTKFEEATPSLKALADHLRASIRAESGSFSYRPVGGSPIWALGASAP